MSGPATSAPTLELRVVELLCARLCHELVGPIGAISNGIELLDEEASEFARPALSLIGQSALKAGQRLQFYRFAYGFSPGALGDRANPADLATGLLAGSRVSCGWQEAATRLPLEWQRLACNLLVVAAEALPRGGRVSVEVAPVAVGEPGARPGIRVAADGAEVAVAAEIRAALLGTLPAAALAARLVHAHFTACLAAQIGARLALTPPESAAGATRAWFDARSA